MVAHNTYLTLAVEQGIAGIASHLLLFGSMGWLVLALGLVIERAPRRVAVPGRA